MPGTGPLADARRGVPAAIRDSAGEARARVPRGDRRMPRADAAHIALPAGEQFTLEYVTGKSWSGYNWYQGNFQQPDPGQHRPADLHRSRDRPRVPRGLSRAPRLQRAARAAPGAGARLARVLGVPAVLAAVAHRGRHGELRHRGRVSRRGARRRSSATCCSRSPGSIPSTAARYYEVLARPRRR